MAKLKELCAEDHACEKVKHRLQECNDRVNGKPWTKETCNEELMDFLHCVDECVRLVKYMRSNAHWPFLVLVVTTCLQISEIIIQLETFKEILDLDTFFAPFFFLIVHLFLFLYKNNRRENPFLLAFCFTEVIWK